jgi:hypothetical protein
MFTDDRTVMLKLVEQYARTGETGDAGVTVTCLPDNKTSYVEQNPDGGRSILLDEYRVDGRAIWAGYSPSSGVVYLSSARAN